MDLTFEEYLKYHDVGVPDFAIAASNNISPSTLKYHKRKWKFGSKEQFERRLYLYNKWSTLGYCDKDIAKLIGISYMRLWEFKKKAGLTKEHGWNATIAHKGNEGARPIYY